MSRNASPGHGFSGAFDNFYDPDYTVQISSKMQVPDKISVIEGAENKQNYSVQSDSRRMLMLVPDRILLTGGDEHVETRDPLPELRMESALSQPSSGIGLTAPPRVLTLDEYSYPDSMDEITTEPEKRKSRNSALPLNESTYVADNSISIIHHPEEEIALLRKQVKFLTRRMVSIEQSNQLRQQREIIFCSAGVIYFLLKGLFWLHRHF